MGIRDKRGRRKQERGFADCAKRIMCCELTLILVEVLESLVFLWSNHRSDANAKKLQADMF